MLHRPELVRCGAGLRRKKTCGDSLMRSSKMSFLCRAIDPTFQDTREREEFGFSTLAPLKPLLRQERCLIVTTRSAGASFVVMFHLRRNPCEPQNPDKTTVVGNLHRSWQSSKDHSEMSNPEFPSNAEDETDRCEAFCYKEHSGAVDLEHVQKQSSSPWSPLN